ncbi:MAG: serine/threonine-protein phosphatase [Spirochaetes bacterium]|nr:serine/threonine-protein phosphatase [Spirochaetota bacterium]
MKNPVKDKNINDYDLHRTVTNYKNSKIVALIMLFVSVIFLIQNTLFPGTSDSFRQQMYSKIYILTVITCAFYIILSNLINKKQNFVFLKHITTLFFFGTLTIFIFLNTIDLTLSNELLAFSLGLICIAYIYRIKNILLISYIFSVTLIMSVIILIIKNINTDSIILVFQTVIYAATAAIFGILNNSNHRKIYDTEIASFKKAKSLEKTQRKMQRDLSLAAQVQQKLLPERPLNLKNFDIGLFHKSDTGITGDFYDFYIQDNILKGVSLFDVSGHGIAAGLLTMLAKPLIYRNVKENEKLPLNEVMKKIDADLSVELHGMFQYLTGILLRFENQKVQYVNAAHIDIIFYSAKTRQLTKIIPDESEDGNTILGVDFIKLDFTEINFEIEKGDFIIYFTDGLIDISDRKREHYSMQRLLKFLSGTDFSGNAQNVIDKLIEDIRQFSGNTAQEDDITVIAAKKL